MALYHDATVRPSKADFLAAWVPGQPWCPAPDAPIEVIGAYRFDDPEGRVGMEAHLVSCGESVLHVPLTYREQPVDAIADAFIGEMEHSALGTRWVYDGLGDDRFVMMIAAAALTGQGEALGMVTYDGKWHIAPSPVRLRGGGWTQERISVDDFAPTSNPGDATAAFHNERFELRVHRHVAAGPQPSIGLTATWATQPSPQLLADITLR